MFPASGAAARQRSAVECPCGPSGQIQGLMQAWPSLTKFTHLSTLAPAPKGDRGVPGSDSLTDRIDRLLQNVSPKCGSDPFAGSSAGTTTATLVRDKTATCRGAKPQPHLVLQCRESIRQRVREEQLSQRPPPPTDQELAELHKKVQVILGGGGEWASLVQEPPGPTVVTAEMRPLAPLEEQLGLQGESSLPASSTPGTVTVPRQLLARLLDRELTRSGTAPEGVSAPSTRSAPVPRALLQSRAPPAVEQLGLQLQQLQEMVVGLSEEVRQLRAEQAFWRQQQLVQRPLGSHAAPSQAHVTFSRALPRTDLPPKEVNPRLAGAVANYTTEIEDVAECPVAPVACKQTQTARRTEMFSTLDISSPHTEASKDLMESLVELQQRVNGTAVRRDRHRGSAALLSELSGRLAEQCPLPQCFDFTEFHNPYEVLRQKVERMDDVMAAASAVPLTSTSRWIGAVDYPLGDTADRSPRRHADEGPAEQRPRPVIRSQNKLAFETIGAISPGRAQQPGTKAYDSLVALQARLSGPVMPDVPPQRCSSESHLDCGAPSTLERSGKPLDSPLQLELQDKPFEDMRGALDSCEPSRSSLDTRRWPNLATSDKTESKDVTLRSASTSVDECAMRSSEISQLLSISPHSCCHSSAHELSNVCAERPSLTDLLKDLEASNNPAIGQTRSVHPDLQSLIPTADADVPHCDAVDSGAAEPSLSDAPPEADQSAILAFSSQIPLPPLYPPEHEVEQIARADSQPLAGAYSSDVKPSDGLATTQACAKASDSSSGHCDAPGAPRPAKRQQRRFMPEEFSSSSEGEQKAPPSKCLPSAPPSAGAAGDEFDF
eukprot:RCo052146